MSTLKLLKEIRESGDKTPYATLLRQARKFKDGGVRKLPKLSTIQQFNSTQDATRYNRGSYENIDIDNTAPSIEGFEESLESLTQKNKTYLEEAENKLIDQELNSRIEQYQIKKDVEEYHAPLEDTSFLDIHNTTKFQEVLMNEGYSVGDTGADGKLGPNTIKGLQRFLGDRGYDLGEYGPNKDGVDGRLGKKTREALNKYNQDNSNSSVGAFSNRDSWKCERGSKECAESVDYILYDYYGITSDEKVKAGIFGDAWERERKILNAENPGTPLYKKDTELNYTNKFNPGDLVFLYNTSITGSPNQEKANKVTNGYYGDKAPTHTGIVDSTVQYDNSNKPFVYVAHNINGTVYREKLFLNKQGKPILKHNSVDYELISAVRPALENLKPVTITPNPDIQIESRNNPVAINASNSLMDLGFREKSRRLYGLTEKESMALTLATLGIMEQETKMGEAGIVNIFNRQQLMAKEFGASALTLLRDTAAGDKIEEIVNRNIPREASQGFARVKFNENFSNKKDFFREQFGLQKYKISSIIDDGSNSAKAAFLILAGHFNQLRQKHNTDEALYLAIQKYNRFNLNKEVLDTGKTSVEFGKERDLNYSNKVISFAQNYRLKNSDGNEYKTTLDNLNIDRKVVQNQLRLKNSRIK